LTSAAAAAASASRFWFSAYSFAFLSSSAFYYFTYSSLMVYCFTKTAFSPLKASSVENSFACIR
jgi:hypothetical protein